MYRVEYVTTNF